MFRSVFVDLLCCQGNNNHYNIILLFLVHKKVQNYLDFEFKLTRNAAKLVRVITLKNIMEIH